MDVSAYLWRIGYAGSTEPTLDVLRKIHYCHMMSIPFESLSIHCGEKITMNPHDVYDKIVRRCRGGFCFENNSLFFWLLEQLGYQPIILSAQVRKFYSKRYGPPCDHLVLLVELDGQRWLCDVGFGDSFHTPLLLEAGTEQAQENGLYRFSLEDDFWYLESFLKLGGAHDGTAAWSITYKFTLAQRQLKDFHTMCDYYQTSPSSLFFCKSFCSLHLPQSLITYMGLCLITTTYSEDSGSCKETRVLQEAEIASILREKFGIVLTGKLIPKDEEIVPPPEAY